jgi:hypothetical protein
MSELILYTIEDRRSQIKLRAEQQAVWLTQLEMAELFDATMQNISLQLKNLFEDGELEAPPTTKKSLIVQFSTVRVENYLYEVARATTEDFSAVDEYRGQWA